MVDSLRDQLLKSGIVKKFEQEKRAQAPAKYAGKGAPGGGKRLPQAHKSSAPGSSHNSKPSQPRRTQAEIDLAKAYAIRAQTEASERKRAEQEAAEQARIKRERKAKLQQLLEGKVLNKKDADQVRHFEYGGKIRRVYVDATQLAELNAGRLGVVQHSGHYLLVSVEIAEQARAIDPHQLALLVDPSANGVGEDGVPDDLMW